MRVQSVRVVWLDVEVDERRVEAENPARAQPEHHVRERWLAEGSDGKDRVGGDPMSALIAIYAEAVAPDDLTALDQCGRQPRDAGELQLAPDRSRESRPPYHACDRPSRSVRVSGRAAHGKSV